MSVEVGQQYETTAVVTDRTGALVAPSAIHLNVTLPDGTVVNLDGSIQLVSLGTYYADYLTVQEGLHVFVWTTTGPVTYKTDYCNANVFRSVIGIDEAKSYISFDSTSGREDILRQIMHATTELIEDVVGVTVPRTFTNQKITGDTCMIMKMPHAPLVNDTAITSISSVFSNGITWTQANNAFIVFPNSGTVQLASRTPFIYGPWKATYKAGRQVIPAKIQLAAKEIIYDLWASQRQFGMDTLEPGPEDTARWEQMLAVYKIPPHAMAMLSAEERPGFR